MVAVEQPDDAAYTEQHDLVEWPGHREQPERAAQRSGRGMRPSRTTILTARMARPRDALTIRTLRPRGDTGHARRGISSTRWPGVRPRTGGVLEGRCGCRNVEYEVLNESSWHSSATARIVVEAATSHGGTVVKNQGDGFMLAFPSAGGALACSQAMQRLIRIASAASGGEILVSPLVQISSSRLGRSRSRPRVKWNSRVSAAQSRSTPWLSSPGTGTTRSD